MLSLVHSAVEKGLSYRNGQLIGISGKVLTQKKNAGKGYKAISIQNGLGGYTNGYVHKLVYWFVT